MNKIYAIARRLSLSLSSVASPTTYTHTCALVCVVVYILRLALSLAFYGLALIENERRGRRQADYSPRELQSCARVQSSANLASDVTKLSRRTRKVSSPRDRWGEEWVRG